VPSSGNSILLVIKVTSDRKLFKNYSFGKTPTPESDDYQP
jgi:hypothetical protein